MRRQPVKAEHSVMWVNDIDSELITEALSHFSYHATTASIFFATSKAPTANASRSILIFVCCLCKKQLTE